METALVGRANVFSLPLVAKATGGPIVGGTVNFYLAAVNGSHADKWYRGSDTSWQIAKSIAGVATHRADGRWYLSLPSEVWALNVRYELHAEEEGDLHIPVGTDILATTLPAGTGTTAMTYTVLDEESQPIEGVSVWVSSDEAGAVIVALGTTNGSGKVTFMLNDSTTYYLWRQKAGYNFTNPDVEVVP